MSKPDNHTIEAVLQHRGTASQSKQVTDWLLTEEGMHYLSQRIDNDMYDPSYPLIPKEEIPSGRVKLRLLAAMRKQKQWRQIAWVAATILPLVLILSLFVYINDRVELFPTESLSEVTAPADEQLSLFFQDGSKARLNAGTKIRFPKQFGLTERRVYLEGEAFFEVAPSGKRCFVVETPHLDVEVKGTDFNVNAFTHAENVIVHLYSGVVALHNPKVSRTLQPDDIATYHIASGKVQVERATDDDKLPIWVSKRFRFFNTPLPEVLTMLSKAYNIRFEITDPALDSLEYTLTEYNASLDVILLDMEKISPIKIRRLADHIEICSRNEKIKSQR